MKTSQVISGSKGKLMLPRMELEPTTIAFSSTNRAPAAAQLVWFRSRKRNHRWVLDAFTASGVTVLSVVIPSALQGMTPHLQLAPLFVGIILHTAVICKNMNVSCTKNRVNSLSLNVTDLQHFPSMHTTFLASQWQTDLDSHWSWWFDSSPSLPRVPY